MYTQVIFIAVIVVVFWLSITAAQRLARRRFQRMVSGLREGDRIVTVGGLYGVIRAIAADHVQLEIAPRTEVRILRRAIAGPAPVESSPNEDGELTSTANEPDRGTSS